MAGVADRGEEEEVVSVVLAVGCGEDHISRRAPGLGVGVRVFVLGEGKELS